MISAPILSQVANHIWQSTVVAICIGLLTLVLRRNSARVRHVLWMAASAKFLLPFSLLIALGASLQPITRAPMPQPAVSVVLGQITEPFSSQAHTITLSESAVPSASADLPVASPTAKKLPMLLVAIWACGFFGVLFAWSHKWRTIQAAVKNAQPVGAIGNISILSSRSTLEPGVFGVFKPVLLLPEGIRSRLSEDQLNAVFAHELFHVRWRDNLTAACHMFVEAVFWFHPLVWWIGKRLVDERELACDEAVLHAGNEPEVYAQGILNVCKAYVESPLVCVSGVTGADLKRRIVRIAANRLSRQLDLSRKLLLCAAGVFAVVDSRCLRLAAGGTSTGAERGR